MPATEPPAPPAPASPVLRGGRVTVRLGDDAVTWTRGRVTRRFPLPAVRSVDFSGGRLTILLADGEAVEVSCPSGTEGELFTVAARRELARPGRRPDGAARVTLERRPALTPGRRWLAYAGLFIVAAATLPSTAPDDLLPFAAAVVFALPVATACTRALARRVLLRLRLRRDGVTVRAEVLGPDACGGLPPPPRTVRFATVDGRLREVPAERLYFAGEVDPGPVEVTYVPQEPDLVGRPRLGAEGWAGMAAATAGTALVWGVPAGYAALLLNR